MNRQIKKPFLNEQVKTYVPKLKQTTMLDYFSPPKIYGYNKITDDWHCTSCGVPMGKGNPRQLCGKWKCDYL